jgi:hypothetical protein
VTGRKDSLQGRAWRLPADQLEQFIAQSIQALLTSPGGMELIADANVETLKQLQSLSDADLSEVLELLKFVQVREGTIALRLNASALAAALNVGQTNIKLDQLTFDLPFTRKRRGVETRLVMSGPSAKIDQALVANIARAHAWLDRVTQGESFDEISASDNTSKKRVQQTLEYAFLAPDIVRGILAGQQPLGLTSTWVATHAVPSDWAEQRRLIATL